MYSLGVMDAGDMEFLEGLAAQFDEEWGYIESYRWHPGIADETLRGILAADDMVVLGFFTANANGDGMVITSFDRLRDTVAPDYKTADAKGQSEINGRVRVALDRLVESSTLLKRTRKLKGQNGYLSTAYFMKFKVLQ